MTMVNVLTTLLTVLGAGGIYRLFTTRTENRHTGAETSVLVVDRQQTLDEMQADILAKVRQEYADMSSKLDKAMTQLAEERRKGAEKDLKIEVLERGMERQHDEIASLRAQLGLEDRRTP